MLRRLALALPLSLLSACGSLIPHDRGPIRPQAQATPRAVAVAPANRLCLAELGVRRASFAPLPDRYFDAGCSTVGAVSLTGLQGDEGRFEIANLGAVACALAETLAAWARFGVDRAAREVLGSPLVRIETMGSYTCRNVAGTSRRSAHATAQAVDVAAFVLADGRRVSVLGDWSGNDPARRRFLALVHASACKRFGTVLGPGYNAAHRDHFHLERAGSTGLCR